MYAGSLESTRYLLLTEFEGRTACNRTSFFRSDLWPKHKVRRSHKLSRKNMLVLTVSTYVIEQQNFLRYLHLALKGGVRWTKSVQVVNDSATYSDQAPWEGLMFKFLTRPQIIFSGSQLLARFKLKCIFLIVLCQEIAEFPLKISFFLSVPILCL